MLRELFHPAVQTFQILMVWGSGGQEYGDKVGNWFHIEI